MPAIKKSEVGKLSQAELTQVGELENALNPIVNREYRKGGCVTVQFDTLERILGEKPSLLVVNKIVADYEAAGWTVKVVLHDQRDGDFLQFS